MSFYIKTILSFSKGEDKEGHRGDFMSDMAMTTGLSSGQLTKRLIKNGSI
jgi:hypothetical protein